MRIATISYHTCPLATLGGKDTGGMNVYVRELTRHLGRLGVHVDVFTRSQDEHVPHVLHDLGYGNRVVHVPAGPEVPLAKQDLAIYLPEFVQNIRDFAAAKDLHYDLIHSHYWMSGIAARDLKAAWNVPVVHMFHTLGLMKQRVARLPGEAEGDYRLEGEREVLRMANRIVAATPAELAQLQWLYHADTRKVAVIPPGVDVSHFYPIPADEAKEVIGAPPCSQLVLFVGRIEPLKGLDTLIQAIRQMREQDVRVCLAVIGGEPEAPNGQGGGPDSDRGCSGGGGLDGDLDGGKGGFQTRPYSSPDNPDDPNGPDSLDSPAAVSLTAAASTTAEMRRITSMTEAAGLSDLVTFLGKRGQDTLPYYYSAAEVVVMPSHYESFGMVALEAMACGTPVVASQVGGLAFLVQDGVTGFTVPVDEPGALADKLTLILTNPGLRQQLGEQAAAVAQQYAWESIAARILALYSQALTEGSARHHHPI